MKIMIKCLNCNNDYWVDSKDKSTRECPYCKELKKSGKVPQVEQDIPKCPTCGSDNVRKISAANKVGSAALFGIFSVGHVSKVFKCNNCGAEW